MPGCESSRAFFCGKVIMTRTGAQLLVECLLNQDVDMGFGVPGGKLPGRIGRAA